MRPRSRIIPIRSRSLRPWSVHSAAMLKAGIRQVTGGATAKDRSPADVRQARARRRAQLTGWLTAPIALSAIVAGVVLIRSGPIEVPLIAVGFVAALVVCWLLISTLFPAHLDRVCPDCGVDGIEVLDASTQRGVQCPSCGWQDEEQSGYLIAEADGLLIEGRGAAMSTNTPDATASGSPFVRSERAAPEPSPE
ncbi:MAG: hypothetical protein ACI841_000076 [Planctomycetota bacterium]|jgi:hypothetical protein